MSSRIDLTECPSCFAEYLDPKLLPCQHTVCLECLVRVEEEKQVTCPTCEVTHKVPERGVKSFIENQHVVQFVADKKVSCASNIILCKTGNSRYHKGADFAEGELIGMITAHLHASAMSWDIVPKSIPCILVRTVTPGRSDVTAISLPNGFATHLGVTSQPCRCHWM